MKVLIVSNNAYMKGNGVCTAIVALRSRLINQGIDVRILACENPDKQGPQPEYPQGHFVFPIFEPIIRKSGFRYSKIDKRSIREAITWADVVHLMEGFPIEAAAAKIAKELGKPCVGTFHTFTQNITANLGFTRSTFINKLVDKWWSSSVYNHCKCVQCPTQTVKEYLEANGYT
jgi:glycosyltransferase involved in cell wall biosynthesis